jgi:multiple antibiotic resistance protein
MIIAMVKDFDFKRQRVIMLREGFFAFLLALFFQFFGDIFLKMLNVSNYALTLTGGILLFMTALLMLFHKPEPLDGKKLKQEPFIVPIATPLLSGPGLMTIIMITSAAEKSNLIISLAIVVAWIGVMSILAIAPYLQKLLGKRGLAALEQVMGMVLGLIAMQMIVDGAKLFVKTLSL